VAVVLKSMTFRPSWRKQAVERGPLSLLERKARETPPTPPNLDGEQQAQLVKLACSQPPEGHARWSLRLLVGRRVQWEVLDKIGPDTVRRALKKTTSRRGAR